MATDEMLNNARQIAAQCWTDEATASTEMDSELCEAFAQRLASWIEQATESAEKLNFLKSKGLTVGTMKEAGKEPCLAYVIEPGTELCDLETVNKLTEATIAAKSYATSADYYLGVLDACYKQLPDEMKRRACLDAEHNFADKPILSNLPGVVKFLVDLSYVWVPGELTIIGAQIVLDEVLMKLAKIGFGFVADGTVYGNGIFVDRLRAVGRVPTDRSRPFVPSHCGNAAAAHVCGRLPGAEDHPDGLHCRYVVSKADGSPCDPNAAYFVLRLDNGGTDPAHLRACRFAARMYALFIQTIKAEHLQRVAIELDSLCNGFNYDDHVDFEGLSAAEIRFMFKDDGAFEVAKNIHEGQEVQAEAFGVLDSAKWHRQRIEFLKTLIKSLGF